MDAQLYCNKVNEFVPTFFKEKKIPREIMELTSLLTSSLAFYYLEVIDDNRADIQDNIIALVNHLADIREDVIDNLLGTDFFLTVYSESIYHKKDYHNYLEQKLNKNALSVYNFSVRNWTKYN